eukprot:TRINITY_DN703_c0_g1_i5.p1 TRINITY_DN703_c0_g1~~TRINITY_DN703_c0_g1_i5.p1  ORF type:complete len:117 (-),score=6.05 TRINITY_DN703_c0_g1_i5:489-839(-)
MPEWSFSPVRRAAPTTGHRKVIRFESRFSSKPFTKRETANIVIIFTSCHSSRSPLGPLCMAHAWHRSLSPKQWFLRLLACPKVKAKGTHISSPAIPCHLINKQVTRYIGRFPEASQ